MARSFVTGIRAAVFGISALASHLCFADCLPGTRDFGALCPGECRPYLNQFLELYSLGPGYICYPDPFYACEIAILSVSQFTGFQRTLDSNGNLLLLVNEPMGTYTVTTFTIDKHQTQAPSNYAFPGEHLNIAGCYEESFTPGGSSGSGSGTGLGPINTHGSCQVAAKSSINMDTLSLSEDIPIQGAPFTLIYSSDRFRANSPYSPARLGLGGWTPNIVHYYDVADSIFYTGDGDTRPIQPKDIPEGFYITDQAGTEIYYFDGNGIHTKTKDALTGVVKNTFTYDSQGRLASIVDQFGNTSSISYSVVGATFTSQYGQVTNLVFDTNGFLTSVTNSNNETYNITNSSTGLLLNFQKPMGQKSTVTYDDGGLVTKDLGQGGDFISMIRQFDQATGVQTVTSSTAMNRQTIYKTAATKISGDRTVLDPFGGSSNSTDQSQGPGSSSSSVGTSSHSDMDQDPRFGWMAPFNKNSTYTVNGSNISIAVSTQKSAVLANPADPLSLISETTTTTLQNDPNRVYTSVFLAADKSTTMTSPMNRVTTLKQNEFGSMSSIQTGSLIPTLFSYDSRGRMSLIKQDNRKMTLTYDSKGNVASSTDFLNKKTQFEYDNSSRVTKQIFPGNSFIEMNYDKNGNLTSITPPGKKAHTFTYNLMELVASYLPPALSSQITNNTNYQYNLDKQLTEIDRPDGAVVNYNYSPTSGLLTGITTPTGSYAYTYVAGSNLVSTLTSPDAEVMTYVYSGNIPKSVTSSGPIASAISYNFNADGSVSSVGIAGSDGQIQNTSLQYDFDGLLKQSGDLVLTRNNTGAVSASTLGKINETLSFDSFGQVKSNYFKNGKKIIYTSTFGRDQLGRVSSITESRDDDDKFSLLYSYDDQGRLSEVKREKSVLRKYLYDANGNRTEVQSREHKVKAEYDDQDRLIKYGNLEFKYNANGDLAEKIEKNRDDDHEKSDRDDHKDKAHDKSRHSVYVYDVFGNLKSVTLPGGRKIEYIIDGQNRRVGKKINGVLVQGFLYGTQTQIVAELDGSGKIVKQFVYGEKGNIPDYMIYRGKEYRIISNQVGTPEMLVDASSGKIVQKYEFDEFGVAKEHAKRSLLPFGFAGGIDDQDTGLVRFGARDYDPQVGRFVNKDPIGFNGGDTNLMSYVANDPVNFIDPTGKSTLNLFPANDPLNAIDSNLSGIPGSYSVGVHGNPSVVGYPNGSWTLSPQGLAGLLNVTGHMNGQPVQLNSCSTGGQSSNGQPSFAQQLSNTIGVPVTAPTQDLWIFPNGGTTVNGNGTWQTFFPSAPPFK